ncbi:MAG: hypothetical protein LBE91_09635 [Tannerella sp.]|jgi:predicted aspartyl protease|nr:hypothetical protein [Tannerella sp.]
MKKLLKIILIVIASVIALFFILVIVAVIYSRSGNSDKSGGMRIVMKGDVDSIDFRTFPGNAGELNILSPSLSCYIFLKMDSTILEPVNFDTGFPETVFNLDNIRAYEIFGLQNMTNAFGGIVPGWKIKVNNFKIGHTVIEPNDENIYGYNSSSGHFLGVDIQKKFVWKIDNIKQKLFFSQTSSYFDTDGCICIPFKLENNCLFIPVTVDGKVYDARLDTGFDGFLNIRNDTENSSSLSEVESVFSSDFMTRTEKTFTFLNTGIKSFRLKRTVSTVQIGTLSFENEIIDHAEFLHMNLLGWDFFQRFDYVIFDYLQQKLYLGPSSGLKSYKYLINLRESINSMGLSCRMRGDFCTINGIADSLVNRGLQLGDTIVKIDDVPTTTLSRLKMIYSRTSAKITVKRGTRERSFKVYRSMHVAEPDTVMSYNYAGIEPIYRDLNVEKYGNNGKILKYFDFTMDTTYFIGDKFNIYE